MHPIIPLPDFLPSPYLPPHTFRLSCPTHSHWKCYMKNLVEGTVPCSHAWQAGVTAASPAKFYPLLEALEHRCSFSEHSNEMSHHESPESPWQLIMAFFGGGMGELSSCPKRKFTFLSQQNDFLKAWRSKSSVAHLEPHHPDATRVAWWPQAWCRVELSALCWQQIFAERSTGRVGDVWYRAGMMALCDSSRQRLPWQACSRGRRGCWWGLTLPAADAVSRNVLSSSGFFKAKNWLFFHKSFQTQLRDHFHSPHLSSLRTTVYHLTQTPITALTPTAVITALRGSITQAGSQAVTRLLCSLGPHQLQTISLVCGEGWASGGKHRFYFLLSSRKKQKKTEWIGLTGRLC